MDPIADLRDAIVAAQEAAAMAVADAVTATTDVQEVRSRLNTLAHAQQDVLTRLGALESHVAGCARGERL